MKLNNKRLIFRAILLIIFTITFVGCDKLRINAYKENTDNGNEFIEENIKDDIAITNSDDIGTSEDKDDESDKAKTNEVQSPAPTNETVQPISNIELMVYVVNGQGDLETRTALVSQDINITPEVVLETVVESMADNSIIVGIEDVTSEGDAIIVSFYSDKAPLSNVGSGIELGILNAIAQSLLDNLDNYNKIIYRAEGDVYSSGHMEFDIDEVYMER